MFEGNGVGVGGGTGAWFLARVFTGLKLSFGGKRDAAEIVAWSLPRVETVNIDNE